MKLFIKFFAVFIILGILFIATFVLWGGQFESIFSQKECIIWFSRIKSYAWVFGIGLLISDILLPVPATGIMAALGSVYGFPKGALLSIVGSMGAGIAGYYLAKYFGRNKISLFASDKEINQFQEFFNSYGGFAIIISRVMPVLPEVMTILAGFAGMKPGRFYASLALGTIPVCFLFSLIGHTSWGEPGAGIVFATFVPLAIWPVFLKFIGTGKKSDG